MNESATSERVESGMRSQAGLLRGIATVLKRARATRSSIRVLNGAVLRDGCLHATDMVLSASSPVVAPRDFEGMVDLDRLTKALKGLASSADCVLDVEDGRVVLSHELGRADISLSDGYGRRDIVDSEDFPVIPVIPMESIVPEGWQAEFVAVAGVASRDESRPILTGVGVSSDRVVCTDSYRLHRSMVDAPGGIVKEGHRIVVPHELAGLHPKGVWKRAGVADERLSVRTDGGWTFTARLIDGQFPDDEQLVPESGFTGWAAPSSDAVKRVAYLEGLAERNVPLRIESDGEVVGASIVGDDASRSAIGLHDGGESFVIGVNAGFFGDALGFADGGRISVISAQRPLLLGRGDRTALVMPVRLSS